MLITHTENDKAVGIAHPLASRIARHDVSALGDEDDPYDGLGWNGAQRTPEAQGFEGPLKTVGEDYSFQCNRVFNLRAVYFIKDHRRLPAPPSCLCDVALHHRGVAAKAW